MANLGGGGGGVRPERERGRGGEGVGEWEGDGGRGVGRVMGRRQRRSEGGVGRDGKFFRNNARMKERKLFTNKEYNFFLQINEG